MTARNSTKARRICFDGHRQQLNGKTVLQCHICKTYMDPIRDKWRADHIRRHAEDGEDTPKNLWPICIDCDSGVGGKASDDTKAVAKGKRVRDNHYGIKQRGWRRPDGVKYDWKQGRYIREDD